MRDVETISADVVDIALRLHRRLGPGLIESVYETVLAIKLGEIGYHVARQVPIDIEFENLRFAAAFRADLIIDHQLIIEVKSVEKLTGAHAKQLLTYLRLTNQPLGLLINFSGETLKEGLRRVVNGHTSFASSRLRVNQINRRD
jgi:GxxExxY protein